MKKIITIFVLALLVSVNAINAQGFKKPADGKAAVYFTRTVTYGSKMLIDIFDGEEYVAYSVGKGYSVYECNPGKHVFWVSAENTDFITADLEAGKIYIAQVYVYPGVMKGRVSLVPNSPKDTKLDGYNASIEIVNKIVAKEMRDKSYTKRKDKFTSKAYMTKKMEGYKTTIEGKKEVPNMSKDMFVDPKELK